METASESKSEDKAPPTKKKLFTPVPQGTRSPQMFTAQAIEALSREEEPTIMVREDEADAFGAILAQLSLKKGLKAWRPRRKCSRRTICLRSYPATSSLCRKKSDRKPSAHCSY